MARQDYTWLEQTDFRGGIQESPEEAAANQVYDARNVWIDDGLLKTRPGYTWVGCAGTDATGVVVTGEALANDDLTIGGLTLDAYAVGKHWYFGLPADSIGAANFMYAVQVTNGNANAVIASCEYYGANGWTPMPFVEVDTATSPAELERAVTHLPNSSAFCMYCRPPADWALYTISATSKYWFRFTLLNNGAATLDATVRVSANAVRYYNSVALGLRGISRLRWPSKSDYVFTVVAPTATYISLHDVPYTFSQAGLTLAPVDAEPASTVVIPEYQTAFTAYGYRMAVLDGIADAVTLPTAETADYLVGAPGGIKAPYHPDYIVHSAMPNCKYLAYYQGHVIAANIQDNPQMLQWSAPGEAFRIWPAESGLTINENDQSDISGLAAFGEHLAAFKSDSIWRIVNAGESGLTGMTLYTAVRVPGAVGTVSNASIVNVAGTLLFLAEDGVYAFDGVNKPQKLSDPIDSFIKRITPGRRRFACAVNWRSKNHYLLAVSLDGSNTNTHVLAYDYSLGSWWVWDSIEAQCWLAEEDDNDNEKILFGDGYGHIYQLGMGKTDHGATITSYVESHRYGADDERTKQFRQLRVYGSAQTVSSMDATLTVDDVPGTTGAIDWRSSIEPKVGDVAAVVGSATLVYNTRRDKKKLDYSKQGNWVAVKLLNDERGQEMAIGSIKVGLDQKGVR